MNDDDDDDGMVYITTPEMRSLRRQLDAKWNAIAALVSRQLGHGEFAEMREELREQVRGEVDEFIDTWEEGPEMQREEIQPVGELQQLLREHHEIAERILDLQDADMLQRKDEGKI